jgi:hypothetical protein
MRAHLLLLRNLAVSVIFFARLSPSAVRTRDFVHILNIAIVGV